MLAYLHLTDYDSAKIRHVDKMFESELDFNYINFPSKLNLFIKLKKKRIVSPLVPFVMKEKQSKTSNTCVKNRLLSKIKIR